MKLLKVIMLSLLLFLATGCNTEVSINEEQLKELAWNHLNDDMKRQVIGQEDDLTFVDEHNSGVYTIINNAPKDVWKQSDTKQLKKEEMNRLQTEFNINGNIINIYSITFKTMFDNVSSPLIVYVDAKQKKVIGQKEREPLSNVIID